MTIATRRTRPAGAALAAVTAVALAAGLAGCTSSHGSSTPTTPAPSTSSSAPVSPAGLASRITQGLRPVHSAHVAAGVAALGTSVDGDLALTDGRTTASDLHITEGGATTEVVTVGGVHYAKLATPAAPGKPWLRVGNGSTNPAAQAVASSLSLVDAISSVSELSQAVAAARTVTDDGTATVDGRPVHEYTLTVVPAQVPGGLGSLLKLTGASTLPVRLALDSSDRPVRADVKATVAGAAVGVVVQVSDYDAPVHIAAPPAAQTAG